MTAQPQNENKQTQYTLFNKGVGLKLITTKAGKPLLIGSCLFNGKQIFGTPFTAKKPNKDGTYSEGLVINVIDGEVVTYTDNNGKERQKVQIPNNKEDQKKLTIFLYEEGEDTGIYKNSKNEAVVSPVPESEDGTYRPDYNISVTGIDNEVPVQGASEDIPF